MPDAVDIERPRGLVQHLPNVLTTMRLAAVPVFVLLMVQEGGSGLAPFVVFAAAAFTDFFDGYLARRLNAQTAYGRVVDPLADRLLIVSATTMLAWSDRLPWWALAVVIWRDVLTAIGFAIVRRRVLPEVNMVGKTATALMMVGIAGLILTTAGWPLWFFWTGVTLSIVAFVTYFVTYVGTLRQAPDAVT